jgi:enoyl-CoA hydratase/carnithine racemase
MGEFCEVVKKGRLTQVTINRPEVMNALIKRSAPVMILNIRRVVARWAGPPPGLLASRLDLIT